MVNEQPGMYVLHGRLVEVCSPERGCSNGEEDNGCLGRVRNDELPPTLKFSGRETSLVEFTLQLIVRRVALVMHVG